MQKDKCMQNAGNLEMEQNEIKLKMSSHSHTHHAANGLESVHLVLAAGQVR